MPPSADTSWVWDNYWQANRLASCLAPGAENYSGTIAAFWGEVFGRAAEGAAILDLCTGNGSVPLLALAADKGFDITAIDRADIAPERFVSAKRRDLNAVRFLPGVSVDALPLPDASVGLVTSQYGVEYADLGAVAAEVRRVLTAGGDVAFVIHAAEGAVAADAREEFAACKWLLSKLDLFSACKKALAGSEPAVNAFAKKLRKASSQSAPHGRRGIVQHMTQLLDHTFSVRAQFPIPTLTAKIDEAERETKAHMVRNELLVSAAKTADEVDAFALLLDRPTGLQREALYLQGPGTPMIGWTLRS